MVSALRHCDKTAQEKEKEEAGLTAAFFDCTSHCFQERDKQNTLLEDGVKQQAMKGREGKREGGTWEREGTGTHGWKR